MLAITPVRISILNCGSLLYIYLHLRKFMVIHITFGKGGGGGGGRWFFLGGRGAVLAACGVG